jgi:hypothetical protein
MIYNFEIHKNAWPDLLKNLSENTKHSNLEIKQAAIMTLGKICEKLEKSDFRLSDQEFEHILTGICVGMDKELKNWDIKKTAVSALHSSLRFLSSYMERPDMRNYVMDLLVHCCLCEDSEASLTSYQCLMDMGKIYYDFMSDVYMNVIIDVTLKGMASEDPNLVVASIEFWNMMAEEEKERKDYNSTVYTQNDAKVFGNYIQSHHLRIFGGLTDILLKSEEEDVSESGKSLHDASFKC